MNHLLLSNALIDDDGLITKLGTFPKNIKKEVIRVVGFYFYFFLMRYDERKIHIMLALMVDPRFKSSKLIFSFIRCEHRRWPWVKNMIKILCFLCS